MKLLSTLLEDVKPPVDNDFTPSSKILAVSIATLTVRCVFPPAIIAITVLLSWKFKEITSFEGFGIVVIGITIEEGKIAMELEQVGIARQPNMDFVSCRRSLQVSYIFEIVMAKGREVVVSLHTSRLQSVVDFVDCVWERRNTDPSGILLKVGK